MNKLDVIDEEKQKRIDFWRSIKKSRKDKGNSESDKKSHE